MFSRNFSADTTMNEKQKQGLLFVQTGHNVYIGGQAGVGKTFLVNEVVKWARQMDRVVGLTCTTGIACCLYPKYLDPMTIHKWTGIGDGRFGNTKLSELLNNDDRYNMAKQRIISTDLLIIDEISMLSRKLFDIMESLFRAIRNTDKLFGGIQLLVVGDFLQLPPVRNARYDDGGEFSFCSDHFPSHRVLLHEVIRQDDLYFASVVHAVSIGKPLERQMELYINNLCRPLPLCQDHEIVRLFACNTLVDMYNRDNLLRLRGEVCSFESIDEGEERHLRILIVEKIVWLKHGAKVMLLRNLSSQLVNGLRGRVTGIREEEVDVYFPSINQSSTLQRMNFTVYDPATNQNIAVRNQLPIKLCYAMTVHKAQGMTLDRVEVDCRQIFQPGQLAVAMGRVKSVDVLRVVNFSTSAIIQQQNVVLDFLAASSIPIQEDVSCCSKSVSEETEITTETTLNFSPTITYLESDVDEVAVDWEDDTIDNVLRDLECGETCIEKTAPPASLPDEFNIESTLTSFLFKNPVRDEHISYNNCLDYLLRESTKVEEFCKSQISYLQNIYKNTIPSNRMKVPQAKLTQFYAGFQKHITSDQYKQLCLNLFPMSKNVGALFSVFYQLMSQLRELILKEKTDALLVEETCSNLSKRSNSQNLSDTAKGKIRYIGGYAIAKLHYRNSQQLQSSAYKTSTKHRASYEHAKRSLQFLNYMKANELSLQDSNILGSLCETIRKQNLNRGLTNITDEAFYFFELLINNILKLLSGKTLSAHGQSRYIQIC